MGSSVLEALSKRHQQDLQQCDRMMKEIQQPHDKMAMRDNILRFWNNGLQKHVQSEDMVLVPFLQRHKFNSGYVEVLRREHDTIRLLAQRIPVHEDGVYLYKAFLKLVEQHIDFEEKVLIKKMEEEIPEGELRQLDKSLSSL